MIRNVISLIIESVNRFNENHATVNAAAIAYYAAFSLPSLLLISIALVGFFVTPQDIHGEIDRNIKNVAGQDAAEQVKEIVEAANQPDKSYLATIAGGFMLAIGATGVLIQLQTSLNMVWKVEAQPDQNAWLTFILKRMISLSMVLVMAFLLLVTISARAVLAEVGNQLDAILPLAFSSGMALLLNEAVGFLVIAVLMAAMFRFLPDAKVPWSSVWFGAMVTSGLFTLGKQIMGYYLSVSHPGRVYGEAGSLAIILIWVYYASLIFLFGAQLTQTWSERAELVVEPEDHAVKETD